MVTLVAFARAVLKNAAGWICRSRPHASTEPSAHCRHGVLHIPGNLYRSQGAEVRPSLQERGGKCAATTLPRDLLRGELGEASLGLDFPGSPSEGSAGHPQLCNKPCLFLTYGACPSGAGCNFCHLPHPNQAKLGRSDRELLRLLGEADLLALILPHLRAKILGA